jgi:hypothetical protein
MNKITQKGITPPAPSYLKRGKIRRTDTILPWWQRRLISAGRDAWLFAICFVSILTFCAGLYLGGMTMRNKVAAIAAEMEKTQKQLADCPDSVILVDKNFTQQIGFHPGKKDLVCTGGGV